MIPEFANDIQQILCQAWGPKIQNSEEASLKQGTDTIYTHKNGCKMLNIGRRTKIQSSVES